MPSGSTRRSARSIPARAYRFVQSDGDLRAPLIDRVAHHPGQRTNGNVGQGEAHSVELVDVETAQDDQEVPGRPLIWRCLLSRGRVRRRPSGVVDGASVLAVLCGDWACRCDAWSG
jgi:hypothetical protein